MTAELSAAFGREVALNDREGRVLTRLLGSLQAELGDDLLAVWLYGSRARGEADPAEMDPDLRSDVDLMAIVTPMLDARQIGWDAMKLVEAAADAELDSPVYYSLRVFDAEYLRERHRIHSFFLQEVDRDKVVLHGGPLDDIAASGTPAPIAARGTCFASTTSSPTHSTRLSSPLPSMLRWQGRAATTRRLRRATRKPSAMSTVSANSLPR